MRDEMPLGCLAIVILAMLGWIGFLIWAGISVVNWLVTK